MKEKGEIMKINRISNNYTPNFQSVKYFKLPTKEVLECAAGKFSPETLSEPTGLMTIFSKLFSLNKRDLKEFASDPLGLHLYAISSGVIIRTNNPAIAQISQKIKNLPAAQMKEEINKITNKIGEILNVSVDDAIKEYKVRDNKVSIVKSTVNK